MYLSIASSNSTKVFARADPNASPNMDASSKANG